VNRRFINRGKYANNSNIGKKTLGIIIFIIIIITLLIILKYKTNHQDNNNIVTPIDAGMLNEVANISENEKIEDTNLQIIKQDEIVSVEDIPKKMGGYEVLGKLVIDKIDLEKYVLAVATTKSIDISVAKLEASYDAKWPNMNESGNFCIAGHNYKNLFRRLKELEKGDEFYLVGLDGRKVTYVIYDKFSVNPDDPNCEDCLNPITANEKREVTLVTCNPLAVTRLVLKAEEKI